MTPDFKKMFKVTLKRDGKDVSSNKKELENQSVPKISVSSEQPIVGKSFSETVAQKLLREPYKSEFIQFSADCLAKLNATQSKKDCVSYLNANGDEVGQVYLQNNHIVAVSNSEPYGGTFIHRSESFLNSGFLKQRMLRVYTKRRFQAELTHFCYELYNKDGQMEFCATNIDDSSISNHEGDFVRYIYEKGEICSKEVYAGKEYKFGSIGRGSFYPPVLTSIGGNLNVRYIRENGHLVREMGFRRTNNPLLIIGNKSGAESFVNLISFRINRCNVDDLSVLNDSMCRVHVQEKRLKNFMRKSIEEDGSLNFDTY